MKHIQLLRPTFISLTDGASLTSEFVQLSITTLPEVTSFFLFPSSDDDRPLFDDCPDFTPTDQSHSPEDDHETTQLADGRFHLHVQTAISCLLFELFRFASANIQSFVTSHLTTRKSAPGSTKTPLNSCSQSHSNSEISHNLFIS